MSNQPEIQVEATVYFSTNLKTIYSKSDLGEMGQRKRKMGWEQTK